MNRSAFVHMERTLFGVTPAYGRHWAEVHAAKRAAGPSKVKPKPVQTPQTLYRGQQSLAERLLEAVAKDHQPGDQVNVSELARSLDVRPDRACQCVSHLRAEGRWPYRNGRRGAPKRSARHAGTATVPQ